MLQAYESWARKPRLMALKAWTCNPWYFDQPSHQLDRSVPALGFTRVLGLHVPLGVSIIATAGWLAFWVCTHEPVGRRS